MESITLSADILIIGGGAAGCYAALSAARRRVGRVILVEKAHIERSGCLAAGVNALNAYIGRGHTPEDYVEYARKDAEGLIRPDLVLSMARRLNEVVGNLEKLGLTILKDGEGHYAERGWRNIKINGENLKPLLAAAVRAEPAVTVLNHVNVVSYLSDGERVAGAVGFGVREPIQYVLKAPAVICATGGAAGIYRPNNPGSARQAMWYCPFNSGSGYAQGIRAGAEMTTLEMRFVALRCKDTIAPTGTLAQGAGARQVNRLGEIYEERYGFTTSGRIYGVRQEDLAGRGPSRLRAENLSPGQIEDLYKAYLNMAPTQTLSWVEQGEDISSLSVEIEGTEPYIIGGHTAGGYWVDTRRETTLRGLFAAGDVAGGCPQKYVSGAMAEAEIAIEAALDGAKLRPDLDSPEPARRLAEAEKFLGRPAALFTAGELAEALQKTMDEQAGGRGAGYSYQEAGLNQAEARLDELEDLSVGLAAANMPELMKIQELRDRLTVARSLVAHLKARRETRWPGFGLHLDYPRKEDTWLRYVNSRLKDGRVEIIFRDMVRGDKYEHQY